VISPGVSRFAISHSDYILKRHLACWWDAW